MRLLGIIFLVFMLTLTLSAQEDNVGSGRAIVFNGSSDYIDFGDIYKDLKIPFTISAWVYFDSASPSPGGPIFANRNCTPIYTGFRLFATPTSISVDCGDGFGGNSPVFRKGWLANVNLPKGRWIHIAAVARTFFDMSLYVNGFDVGGGTIGSSSFTMDSSKPGFASTAYFTSNNVIYRYKDVIDDIRLWNRALSESEIRASMCRKLSGSESGLIGYWDFNEVSGNTVLDKSPNKFHGQFVGNPTRVYSGAPIGDVSVFSYPAATTSIADGTLKVEASNFAGSVHGVQLYEVKSKPSQMGGLDNSKPNSPYFGVFVAALSGVGSFTAKGFVNNQPICNASFRTDNSKPTWTASILPQNAQPSQGEYILADGAIASLDLGPDKVVCDQPNYTISTMLTDPAFTYLWNTGATTPSILVTQSGFYSVTVTGPCGSSTDQVNVFFGQKPVFDLGPDKILCSQSSYSLTTNLTDLTLGYLWSTGEVTPSITVTKSGTYSVNVTGPCGVITDQVHVDLKPVFDLGPDKILCNQSNFTLTTNLNDPTLGYLWSTGETAPVITVTQSGFYSVKVTGPCGTIADQIRVDFLQKPVFDLGPDKVVCDQPNFLLTTMLNDPSFTYSWNTGENMPFIVVSQSGTYSVRVTSPCGSTIDQTRIDFYQKPVFDLGPNKIICDQPNYTISTQLNNLNFNYLWSTGQNTPYIVVNQSGNYAVTVASACGIVTDEVQVDILKTPQPFSFGLDTQSCELNKTTLKPYKDPLGFNYLWQDGSTNDSFSVADFGKYWVKIKNGCGEASDTVSFTKFNTNIGFVPNVITPDGDEKNEFFQIDPLYSGVVSLKVLNRWGAEVFFDKNYRNNWNGTGLSPGVYFIVLEGACIDRFKGSLTIIR